MIISADVFGGRHSRYLAVILCVTVLAIAAFVILHPAVLPKSDAISYLKAMDALDHGNAAASQASAYRIIATAGGLWTIIGLSKVTGSYESAWMLLNFFFYIGASLLFYEIVRRIQVNERTALWTTLFLAGNYAMITFGIGYFMDIGGWMFYLASALCVLRYTESSDNRYLWLAALSVGVGGLFKEYAFLGAFLIGLYLAYENRRVPAAFFRKIWRPALIVAVPTLILHGSVYAKYHFTYLDWLGFSHTYYVYASRAVEYVKTLGSLFNILAILAAVGFFYFWKEARASRGADAAGNRHHAFLVCFLLSALPILFWAAITQRVLFVLVIPAAAFASYFLRKIEGRWYLILPILALYLLVNFTMDSFILGFVNLPF